MVLPAAPELRVGRDTELRYVPDSELYYLTGYAEPGAVAVLCPAAAAPAAGRLVLFVRPRDQEQERWTGARSGPDAAKELFGAAAAYPIGELEQRLPVLVAGAERLYFRLGGGREDVEALVRGLLLRGRRTRQRSGWGLQALVDPGAVLDEMRLRKDAQELGLIREAARTTAESFREVLGGIRPDAGEWEVEAALDAGFRRRGADGPAFPTIVASGPNATVLHYIENRRRMQAGELVLLDAGARCRMYAGDVSRTFPVAGRFSLEQRELYEAVVAARDAAVAAVAPGATTADVHRAALQVLIGALVERGVLQGEVDRLVKQHEDAEERAAQRRAEPESAVRPAAGGRGAGAQSEKEPPSRAYVPHKTSHWLGLDVHDVGDYAVRGTPRPLEPGMVLTVEPGLYIPPQDEAAPAALRGLGIRIEDDVVVTEQGQQVLTAALPAAADAVEQLLASRAR